MNRSYELLFENIRAKCQREHWFGPDHSHPKQYEEIPTYDPDFDFISPSDSEEQARTIEYLDRDNPNRCGFVFSRASEEQLYTTETDLGFPLPPLLRALYATIANGGFGPGLGLRGVFEGYGHLGASIYPDSDDTIVAQYLCRSHKHTLDLAEYRGQDTRWETSVPFIDLTLPYGVWPKGLLPICDMGCVQEACVDNQERMFIAAPIDSTKVYWLRQLPWTFEEWLWRWIRNEQLTSRYWAAA